MDAQQLKNEVRQELTRNILPFWMNRFADPRGGWYGRMDGKGRIWPEAPKGAVLNARILWTFSSAFRLLGDAAYRRAADEACIQVRARFVDPEYGGVVWSVDADGSPLDTRKQFYAIAFAIYGLSEYYRATKEAEALQTAVELYRVVETYSFDRNQNGYIEACARGRFPMDTTSRHLGCCRRRRKRSEIRRSVAKCRRFPRGLPLRRWRALPRKVE